MKFFLLLFIITRLPAVHASFNQTNCSNADASVVYSTGFVSNKLLVTFEIDNGTEMVKVKKELTDFNIKELKNILLEKSSTSNCTEGSTSGLAQIRELYFKKVEFSKANGENLPSNILGLSENQKTLQVDYLCETNRGFRTTCHF